MFKDELKKVMEENNLNVTKAVEFLATKGIRTSKASVSQWMSGKAEPTPKKQEVILSAFGVPNKHFDSVRISVEDTARVLGLSPQIIRNGLEDKTFPWGYAIRGTGESFVYFINRKKLYRMEELGNEDEQTGS